MKHLIRCKDLSVRDAERLLARAAEFKRLKGILSPAQKLMENEIVALVFAEPSTRTRISFEISAIRFGAKIVELRAQDSSLAKGESMIDTIDNLYALGCRTFVIRHSDSGIFDDLIQRHRLGVHFVNAGDGTNEHPTQALLDVFTILERKPSIQGLRVAILGDILRSRVARSNMHLLSKMGANVVVAGPDEMMPNHFDVASVVRARSVDEAVEGADVIMALRVQTERDGGPASVNAAEYLPRYGVTQARLARAQPDVCVMHPGPIRRGIEIEPAIADGPASLILKQTENGIFVRMAVFEAMVQES